MFNLRKISPMVRAIGTMGAVAALVGAVTFAQLTSNTVALTPNTLTTATASLAIGAGTSCPGGDTTSTTGLNGTLTPGGAPVTVPFCLDNKGNVPLNITGSIPQDLSGSVAAQHTTLSITCAGLGTISGPLNNWGNQTFAAALTNPGNTPSNCTASASLDSSYTGSGNEAIPAFTINFVGTEPAPAT